LQTPLADARRCVLLDIDRQLPEQPRARLLLALNGEVSGAESADDLPPIRRIRLGSVADVEVMAFKPVGRRNQPLAQNHQIALQLHGAVEVIELAERARRRSQVLGRGPIHGNQKRKNAASDRSHKSRSSHIRSRSGPLLDGRAAIVARGNVEEDGGPEGGILAGLGWHGGNVGLEIVTTEASCWGPRVACPAASSPGPRALRVAASGVDEEMARPRERGAGRSLSDRRQRCPPCRSAAGCY